ncbi:hypothetical protein SAMN06297164_3669 [Nitrosomonas ureae]|uniref:Uncharacterized protein n=1 Tax=Nitrosomonas ureae TaxID=44577 RepID=A0A286AMC0_9PROT|nr:hypothetical protein [Nitrosomonas ureae]SOD23045.1 hypothetical protein SAMN06297164_3669 [Nitrosomonas ureae]
MQIQLNTDNNITGSSELLEHVQKVIEHELRHLPIRTLLYQPPHFLHEFLFLRIRARPLCVTCTS